MIKTVKKNKDENYRLKIRKILGSERAAVQIVESAIVFPTIFFVLIFLIYFGNLLYMKAAITSYTSEAAIMGAAYCQNTWLKDVKESVPTKNKDIKPYKNLKVIGKSGMEASIEKMVKDRVEALGGGFFSAMNAQHVTCKTDYSNYIIAAGFSVETSCRVDFPMKFWGDNSIWSFNIHAYEKASATDNCEIIRDVDMVVDYAQRSEQIQAGIEKMKEQFGKVKDKFKELTSK